MEEIKAITLSEILKNKGFKEEDFYHFGSHIAKVEKITKKESIGKLILVTSTSPTKYGEGKTTLAISLNDALCSLGHSSVVALREPSLGPVFGLKGGATGGGCATVEPEMDINLHFTGDIHAITTANNLLSAIIDNHIFQGNELQLDKNAITHERCMDLNDRSLRNVVIDGVKTHFNISTASEMMAILCLSKDEEDLKVRLGNILVGYTLDKKEVFARDLKCVNALFLLLKDAIKPNLVKTRENNLALIHGGPFANIAHGTNSIISTSFALHNFDYTIVEAGFGSDMGALKYYDIVARTNEEIRPNVVVINTTIQSLKYNGEEDIKRGIANLDYHIENMKKFNDNILVVLNKHDTDLDSEITFTREHVENMNIPFCISNGYKEGSSGSITAAKAVVELAKKEIKPIPYAYLVTDDLEDKITKFCKVNFGAKNVIFSEEVKGKMNLIRKSKYANLPICIAKTPTSISDDAKKLGYPENFDMYAKDIKLFSGAGFITVYFGNILTMPGLSKEANYLKM